ncbi:MAG: hypothetical protein ROZ64_10540 [Burkholderiaceae bacterium]|nr:hypothetical protein [Burkholderiaceae bacterium]
MALFGLDCFEAMVAEGLDIDGYVFLSQVFRSIVPVLLDEPLTLTGHVRSLAEVNKGHLVTEAFHFTNARDEVCIETELRGLLTDDPGLRGVDRSHAPRIPEQERLPDVRWTHLRDKQLTPQKVRVFSQDIGNLIHFDEDYARSHGFRAPLAQGVMSAVWLLSTLVEERVPTSFEVEFRYLRPVFWDSPASLWVHRASDGTIRMAQSRNDEGKPTADMIVHAVSFAPPCTGK